jgi:uncharacterized protein (TIGR02145 family)
MKQILNCFGKALHVLTACAITIFVSCKEEPVPIAVSSITLDSTSMTLIEGETQTLTATISPSNAENQKVLWSSNNSSVASVKDGVVSAIKVGTATITAKSDDGGKTATCTVTVEAKNTPVTGVTLDKTSHEMTEGDEVTLTASVSPENATNKNVSWSSSNTSVATVDNGKVKALKAGTATITVKTEDGNKTATCEITVNAKVYPVTGVTLNKTSYEMTEGDEVNLVAQITPNNATNKNVTWTSSNSTVASVVDGKVTAIKAGAAMITVKTEDGGKTATCEITVNAKTCPVTSVSLDRTAIELTEGDELTLNATITPDNATNKNVTWISSNTSVATVDNGKVTAHKSGFATIIVTTEDGGKTATCEIMVNSKTVVVTDVTLSEEVIEIYEGDIFILTATIYPENSTNKNVSWTSSNTSVTTVENGKVTAHMPGSSIITVITEDGNKTASCEVMVLEDDGRINYVDEYNINHGRGVQIGETIWAPVNCGYHATDYKYGKLYQWGRKYGHGYNGNFYDGDWDQTYSDASEPTIYTGPVQFNTGQEKSNSNKFYTAKKSPYVWFNTTNYTMWNAGTEDAPEKGEYDPCPAGWRLPTKQELSALTENYSDWTNNSDGQRGIFYSGINPYHKDVPQIFLPAAGQITNEGKSTGRAYGGYYWSSLPFATEGYMLGFYTSNVVIGYHYMANGYSVRCVQE